MADRQSTRIRETLYVVYSFCERCTGQEDVYIMFDDGDFWAPPYPGGVYPKDQFDKHETNVER